MVVVRERYSGTCTQIDTTLELRATLRAGPYAWPGRYPLYLITSDAGALCFACARTEYRTISDSVRRRSNDGWRVIGCAINYEDTDLTCSHCNKPIESAYGESNEPEAVQS